MNTQTITNTVPDGYMEDGKGRLVPANLIKPIDIERDDMVKTLIANAKTLQEGIKKFKGVCADEITAFVEMSAQEYDKSLGGTKGNVTLMSYDGKYKIQRSISEYIAFDERLQAAKELIDQCIMRWSEGSRSEIRILIQDAFQTDKQGKINTDRVLGLKRLAIKDEQWQLAMKAISDSVQTISSKTYFRFYERVGNTNNWQPIALDIASV